MRYFLIMLLLPSLAFARETIPEPLIVTPLPRQTVIIKPNDAFSHPISPGKKIKKYKKSKKIKKFSTPVSSNNFSSSFIISFEPGKAGLKNNESAKIFRFTNTTARDGNRPIIISGPGAGMAEESLNGMREKTIRRGLELGGIGPDRIETRNRRGPWLVGEE